MNGTLSPTEKEREPMVLYEDGTIMSDAEVDAMILLIKRGETVITKESVRALLIASISE